MTAWPRPPLIRTASTVPTSTTTAGPTIATHLSRAFQIRDRIASIPPSRPPSSQYGKGRMSPPMASSVTAALSSGYWRASLAVYTASRAAPLPSAAMRPRIVYTSRGGRGIPPAGVSPPDGAVDPARLAAAGGGLTQLAGSRCGGTLPPPSSARVLIPPGFWVPCPPGAWLVPRPDGSGSVRSDARGPASSEAQGNHRGSWPTGPAGPAGGWPAVSCGA